MAAASCTVATSARCWTRRPGTPSTRVCLPASPAPHVQLTIQYVRAALPGETLVCAARAVNVGRRIGSTEAEITQGGRIIARAVASHAVLG